MNAIFPITSGLVGFGVTFASYIATKNTALALSVGLACAAAYVGIMSQLVAIRNRI